MSKRPPRCRRRKLNCVNKRIAELTAHENNIYGVFALAARLARQAAATALNAKRHPDSEPKEFELALDLWSRLSDYAGAAALNCVGGNQTLTEALVTHQFLLRAQDRKEGLDAG
jgi:CHASE2 domain-containing sensor protein